MHAICNILVRVIGGGGGVAVTITTALPRIAKTKIGGLAALIIHRTCKRTVRNVSRLLDRGKLHCI